MGECGIWEDLYSDSKIIGEVSALPSIRRFPTGKVPSEWLRRIVFNKLGVPSDRVLLGPGVGEDAAIIDMGDRVIAIKTDPITGAVGNIGWLVVHINANDIASRGIRPLWFLCVAMLPEGSGESMLREIMDQINAACCEIGVSLISGHTETTPGLERPILVGFMMGEAAKDMYVTTGGARPGDTLILTKTAGIEGTAVLATDLEHVLKGKVDEETLARARSMLNRISVVPEAMKAMEVGGVHSLHDPTEGGVLNGIWELTEAADVGIVISGNAIPVAPETISICEVLDIDPLKLLGSGSMLMAVEPRKAVDVASAIRGKGIEATMIGEIRHKHEGRTMIDKNGRKIPIEAVDQDHLYAVLDRFGIKNR